MLATLDLPALRGAIRHQVAEAIRPPLTLTRRPPLAWRLRQQWLLIRNGSAFMPLLAWLGRRVGLVVAYSEFFGRVDHADGTSTNYGLLSRRVVTTAGVNFLAASFDGTTAVTTLKYGGYGTGTTAALIGDTTLTTELTTQYASSGVRPTGTQAHSTNTYTNVSTLTPSANCTITEFGWFSSATGGAGTLGDHLVFTGVALVAADPDSLVGTFVLTLPTGG